VRKHFQIVMALLMLMAKVSFAMACEPPAKDAVIEVPDHPFAAVASPDDCWLFVTLSNGKDKGAIGVLKNTGGTFGIDHVVPLAGPGFGEVLSPDGNTLVVTEGTAVEMFDTGKLIRQESSPLLKTLQEGHDAGATYAAMSRDGALLFVSDEYAKRVSVFDVASARGGGKALVNRIAVGLGPVGLATSPDGKWLYATSQVGPPTSGGKTCAPEYSEAKPHAPGLLLRIDIAKTTTDPAHAVAGVLPVGCNPVRVAVSPSGKDLWITARGDGALLRLQPESWTSDNARLQLKAYPVGPSPIGVAVRGDDAQVWVAVSDRFEQQGRGVLTGLAYRPGELDDTNVQLMKTGNIEYPREVAFLHDNRTLTVTLFHANRVAIVRTPD